MDLSFWESLNLSPETLQTFRDLLVVLGISFLLGLEREYAKAKDETEKELFAGVRTFPIVGIIGYLAIYLGDRLSYWVYPAVLLAVFAFIIVSYITTRKSKKPGATTEIALMLAFLLSGLVFYSEYLLAAALALLVTTMLALKVDIHRVVRSLSQHDVISIVWFAVITALVLPLLPNVDLGPYGLFNPYKIWFIVSLFIGLNFVAYFLHKFTSSRYSTIYTGVLGGFVSSTATSWYLSRQAGRGKGGGVVQAAGIILASSIMFPRLLIWLLVLNQELLLDILVPVLLLGLLGFGVGIYLSRRSAGEASDGQRELENPINLKDALIFGALYLLIRLLVGYAEEQAGGGGVLLAAGISGLTDVDAITISMAELARGDLLPKLAATAVLVAALSNTLLKYGLCLILGNGTLRRQVSLGFVPILVFGLAYLAYIAL